LFELADKWRALAVHFKDEKSQELMLQIAEDFERLAKRVEEDQASRHNQIPEAYQSKTVRHGPNWSRETIANLAARMRCNSEARLPPFDPETGAKA